MADSGAQLFGETLKLGEASSCQLPVVVGIDFGTAYSGIAYVYASSPQAVRQGAPSAISPTHPKAPTTILLNNDGSYEFGSGAEEKYNQYLMAHEVGKELDGHLYRRFKMILKDKNAGFDSLTATSVAGKEHSLMDLVVKCLVTLKEYALQNIGDGYGVGISPTEKIQWVLTVPAIWNDFGKAFMRKAAFQAGLIATEQSDNLMLVLEPEGAALAVHAGAQNHGFLGVGSLFTVLDCGGGTIDITSYDVKAVSPLQLTAIAAPAGGDWGSESVNEEFRKFLSELLGPSLYVPHEKPFEFYTINGEFDKAKELFDPSMEPVNHFRISDLLERKGQLWELAEVWNAKHPDWPLRMVPQLRNGFLMMSKELMLSFFEPSLRFTVAATRQALATTKGVKFLILVGGYGASSVLIQRVKAEFHLKYGGLTVILCNPTPKPQAAIALGAVQFGLYREVILARVSRYYYGVAMRINGVDDRFTVLVSKGEELPADHSVELRALPISKEQECICWRLFRTHGDRDQGEGEGEGAGEGEVRPPELVHGLVELGTVRVNCPRGDDFLRRSQWGKFMFGGPEIRVEIVAQAAEAGQENQVTRASIEMK